jgi:zinc protease
MKKLLFATIICLVAFQALKSQPTGFKHFQLDNGLSVYLWEDKNQSDVSGRVVVRAGSIDEPEDYTGLAHYLEHMLFKGTQKIGALDWEKEKPLYDEIVKLYDELAVTTDEIKRDTLAQRINRLSIQAAQFTATSEFSNLSEGALGGSGLNAGTSYDMTVYYNNFPSFQIEKWLELNVERLINPVFRSFQAELENVFEEYNMFQDSRSTHVNNFIFSNLYPTHPYARDVIGKSEHLKNSRISKINEFYNNWYVPRNMALVLVGNFNAAEVEPLVRKTFGRLVDKKVPERKTYANADFSSPKKFSAKLGYSPQVVWGYQGVKKGHKDELLLDICTQLLSNGMQTGLLDKLSLDGDISGAMAYNDVRRDDGRLLIFAVPYYDIAQRVYESNRVTEKRILDEVEKLKTGNIEDWLIASVKNNILQEFDLVLENPAAKTEELTELFAYNLNKDDFFNLKTRIENISKTDIQEAAKKYFSGNNYTVSIEEGKPKKIKLKKPNIKAIDQPKGQRSDYATWLRKLPTSKVPETYNNFADVKEFSLYNDVKLFHTENKANDIFTLTIRYGVGTKKMPKLKYATQLMNSAGIMPDIDAQSVRKLFSELNVNSGFSVNDNYFYIRLMGNETNLAEACKLISRQIFMPKLDDKQLDRVKGGEISTRMYVESSDVNLQAAALVDYAIYKDKSDYISRLKLTDVYYAKISELTGEIIRATDYAAEVHYVGKMPANELSEVLKANLAFKSDMKKSESPVIEERLTYEKPTIYFLPNADAQQAKLYFYFNGSDYDPANEVLYDAFYQYFSGGFNGLVMEEIREKNSMAYTAYGAMFTPPIPNKKAYFVGYIGTQSDKAAEAIDLYMKLLKDMPQHPERMEDVKTYLRETYLTNKPSFRSKSQIFNSWKMLGYADDPAKVNMSKIDALTFEQLIDFYNKEIKNKAVTIIITGDPKTIDLKKITSNHGKVTRVNAGMLFSKE